MDDWRSNYSKRGSLENWLRLIFNLLKFAGCLPKFAESIKQMREVGGIFKGNPERVRRVHGDEKNGNMMKK